MANGGAKERDVHIADHIADKDVSRTPSFRRSQWRQTLKKRPARKFDGECQNEVCKIF
jgi:hypothetical protein